MLELGGVPTEERFRKLTEVQWAILMRKHVEMKMEKRDQILDVIEYLAQMTSPSPKAVFEIVKARKKDAEKHRQEMELEDDNVVAEDEQEIVKNYNIDGEIVNTSFEDAIKAAMGEDDDKDGALKAILGNDYSAKKTIYTVDKRSLGYLKSHGDLDEKMQKIMQQSLEKPLMEQGPQLLPEEIAALKALEFDTISF